MAGAAASIVITGASSGLGRELALSYARTGVTLGLIARRADKLLAVADACRAKGAHVETAVLDVTDARALVGWIGRFDFRHAIDLVIANAGVSAGPPTDGYGEGLMLATKQIQANLQGCINTVEPLIRPMTERGSGQIVVVASIAGLRGLPYSPAYSASKAGIRAYGEGLRAQLRPSGVAVTVVCPGFFVSAMTERFKGATPFLLTTHQATRLIRRGIDRRRSRISFHPLLVAGLKLADLLPARLGDAILRRVRFHIEPPQ